MSGRKAEGTGLISVRNNRASEPINLKTIMWLWAAPSKKEETFSQPFHSAVGLACSAQGTTHAFSSRRKIGPENVFLSSIPSSLHRVNLVKRHPAFPWGNDNKESGNCSSCSCFQPLKTRRKCTDWQIFKHATAHRWIEYSRPTNCTSEENNLASDKADLINIAGSCPGAGNSHLKPTWF